MFFARPVSSASKRMFGVSIFVDKSKNGFCGKMNPTNRTNRPKKKKKSENSTNCFDLKFELLMDLLLCLKKQPDYCFLTDEGSSQFALNGFCSFKLSLKSSNFPDTQYQPNLTALIILLPKI